MSNSTPPKVIRAEVVSAYSHCSRKAFLLRYTQDRGTLHEFLRILEERTATNRARYLTSLKETKTSIGSYRHHGIASGLTVLTAAGLQTADLRAHCDALTRIGTSAEPGTLISYEPTIVIGTYAVEKEQILNLAFVGYLLSQLQSTAPTAGHLITAAGERQRVNLGGVYKTVNSIVERIRGWSTDPPVQPPPVFLNKHCPYCPFKKACAELAEAADDLSLLDRMTTKAARRYQKKGIFTVRQLSFLFRPRRRRGRPQRAPHFDFEIQALAIRTGKIYLQSLPEIQRKEVELFLDIEGIPDQHFSYLIGLLIRDANGLNYYSFWADTMDDEGSMWQKFVQKANDYPGASIYHYGSYEPRAIEALARKFGPAAATFRERLVNLTSHVYGKVYFPVRSNNLKTLGKFLGASWTEPAASGLQSLVWRYRWEEGKSEALKRKLIEYNAEDCQAVRLLAEELAKLRGTADSELNVDYVDRPKQNATGLGSELHAAFAQVLRYGHLYDKKRLIRLRMEGETATKKRPGAPAGHKGHQRIVPTGRGKVVRVAPKKTCPKHKGERLQRAGNFAEKVIVDLAFTKNGCRRTITKYIGEKRYCQLCRKSVDPPAITRLGGQLFGHGFRAWAVYQRIILRLPYRVITQTMEDLFRERTTEASIINFIESFAEYYGRTESILINRLRESPFIHVDETSLSIQGVDHYVWAFTDGQHVVFRLTETRETAVVRELLAGYQGVLLSDFYAGYDGVDCRQQKCWVHLIRDLNEELWKFPFNEELQQFVAEVRDLLLPMIEAIDRYGLKARHLRKFQQRVDEFYAAVIEGREYTLDVTRRYQKRFARYREALFRFLDEDGIPWNNNMAERAIRHLAVQRKISGAFFKRGAAHYLVLLGIAQTCRFQQKSFLKFLLSEEIDVDCFRATRRIRISRPIDRRADS